MALEPQDQTADDVQPNDQTTDQTPDGNDEPEEGATPAPNAIDQLAMELGWNPEFTGPNAVDSRTFILRSREINDNLSKNVRSLRRQMGALQEGIETIKWKAEQTGKKEIARLQNEISDLKAERMDAIRNGRVDDVPGYDDRIEALQGAARDAEAKPPAAAPQANPDWDDWVADNPWYNTDSELKQFADNLSHRPEYQSVDFSTRLAKITEAAKKMFPEKFQTPTQAAKPTQTTQPSPAQPSSAAVAPVSPSHQRAKPKSKTKATAADLSYDQMQAAKEMVAMKVYASVDEYAQDLADKMAAKRA